MRNTEKEPDGVAKKTCGFPLSAMLPRVYIMTSLIIPKGKVAVKEKAKKQGKRRREMPKSEDEE